MELIYELIRNFRYFFKSRKMKRFLTIILIVILLFLLQMKVFAADGSFGGGDGGGGFRYPDTNNYMDIVNYISDRIYAVYNVKPLDYTSWYFYDTNANCFRCIVIDNNKFSYYGITQRGTTGNNGLYDIDTWVNGDTSITLYNINLDTADVQKIQKNISGGNRSFNTIFELQNVFNMYNFLYVNANSNYTYGGVTSNMETYNTTYTNKVLPIEPYCSYLDNSNEFIINDYLVINPGSVRIAENTYLPFALELWNSDGDSIGDNVPYLSILLTPNSSYWDNETKTYKIPYTNYLKLWLDNGNSYTIFDNLFTNDHFYQKIEVVSFSYNNDNIIYPDKPDNPDNPDKPDKPDNPDYTSAINNTTNAINDTNNFLKDTNVDDNQFNLPTVNVNDPTSNFFDTIFMGLYNSVTNDEEKTISFEILGNNITISSADFDYLNSNEWNVLRVILSSMWVFGIGIYILKDIRKMIDKIKDGNVENMANDDIKANMV